MTTRAAGSVLLSLLISTGALAGNDEGLSAFNRHDYRVAIREFSSAALAGDTSAVANLVYMGACGEKDSELAEILRTSEDDIWKTLRKAGEDGNAAARFWVTFAALFSGASPPPMDQVKDAARAAAERGLIEAMDGLGNLLSGSNDPAGAYTWFTLAAKRGADQAAGKRERVAAQLTPAERSQAEATATKLEASIPRLKIIDVGACR
jgi:TPR repeat protein